MEHSGLFCSDAMYDLHSEHCSRSLLASHESRVYHLYLGMKITSLHTKAGFLSLTYDEQTIDLDMRSHQTSHNMQHLVDLIAPAKVPSARER